MEQRASRPEFNLLGVGEDAEVETNSAGSSSSIAAGRFDLLPPLALQAVAMNLQYGAKKYGEWNWVLRTPEDHINHSLIHTYAYLASDNTDAKLDDFSPRLNHLIAAVTRALMALEVELHRTQEL